MRRLRGSREPQGTKSLMEIILERYRIIGLFFSFACTRFSALYTDLFHNNKVSQQNTLKNLLYFFFKLTGSEGLVTINVCVGNGQNSVCMCVMEMC